MVVVLLRAPPSIRWGSLQQHYWCGDHFENHHYHFTNITLPLNKVQDSISNFCHTSIIRRTKCYAERLGPISKSLTLTSKNGYCRRLEGKKLGLGLFIEEMCDLQQDSCSRFKCSNKQPCCDFLRLLATIWQCNEKLFIIRLVHILLLYF